MKLLAKTDAISSLFLYPKRVAAMSDLPTALQSSKRAKLSLNQELRQHSRAVMKTVVACLLAGALVLSLASPCLANGRFPRAQRLLEQPGDADHLLLGATYGLLSSRDRGASWQHICELSFGIVPASADPLLELSSAGILSGLLQGVTLSEDAGCDFALVLGGEAGESIPDISVDKSERSRVLGLRKTTADASVVTELVESVDGGRTFTAVGDVLPADFSFPLTLDSAPSEPSRLYVSGVTGGNVGQILHSNDGGTSWSPPVALPGTSYINAPFIAAVDPHRADLLYVRSDGRELVDQQVWAKDSLFIGDLTGEEGCALSAGFCEVFSVRGKLLGFALSPDGEHVLMGLGDPRDPGFSVDPRFVGLYSGTAADLLAAPAGGTFPPSGFKRVHSAPVSCVTWTDQGIYVCTSQSQKGFALGFAPDLATLELDDLTPLLDLNQVEGPLSCPAEATTSMCGPEWESTCEDLGACGNASGDGGAGGSDAAGQGGAHEGSGGKQAPGAAGQPTTGGASSTGGGSGSGAGTAESAADDAGCGCRIVTTSLRSGWLAATFLLLLFARRRGR